MRDVFFFYENKDFKFKDPFTFKNYNRNFKMGEF